MKVADLMAHPQNFRLHNATQSAAVAASINDLGIVRSVLVAEDGTIIDGHLRVSLAINSGLTEIPVEVVNLTPDEVKKALLLLDYTASLASVERQVADQLLRECQDLTVDPDMEALFIRFGQDVGAKGKAIDLADSEGDEDEDEDENEPKNRCPKCGFRY